MDDTLTNRKKRLTVTIPQLADLFGIHVKTAYDQSSRSALPVSTFRIGRRVLASRAQVEALLGEAAVSAVLDRGVESEPATAS